MVTYGQLDDPQTKKTAQMCWKRGKKNRVFIGIAGVLTGFRLIISYVTQLALHNRCFESLFPQDVATVLGCSFLMHIFNSCSFSKHVSDCCVYLLDGLLYIH